ncbi:zinc-finger domain-containing protein [Fictibacillus gelatini]|uniref:zinc-finger domain-containing protein n=1 Tax=Fictibacillus gelatini TaxID=225985 RepID=UPI00041C5C2E|nr:zinc-finger domain-containing protein [Fictibacillus gelatini]
MKRCGCISCKRNEVVKEKATTYVAFCDNCGAPKKVSSYVIKLYFMDPNVETIACQKCERMTVIPEYLKKDIRLIMNRKQIIYRIGDLIEENCKGCKLIKRNERSKDYLTVCPTCDIGKELRLLGNELNKGRKKEMPFSKEIYLDFKAKGVSDRRIEEKFSINHNKLYQMKKEWGLTGERGKPVLKQAEEPKQEQPEQPASDEKPMSEWAAIKAEWQKLREENERLKQEKESIVQMWKAENEQLSREFDDLKRKYEAITTALKAVL